MKLSEAEKALIAAKLKGEDQIVFYSDECDELIERARAKGEQTEEDKIADEYLNKAAPAMNTGAGAGFAGATRPSAPSVDAPTATQGDTDEMAALQSVLSDENAPAAPEQTHAAKDFEKQLHDEAWKGEEEDMANDGQKQQRLDAVKQQVVDALQTLKIQAPMMEQLKQVAPQAYKAMVALTQSVVGMARELAPAPQGAPMAKSEQLAKAATDKVAKLVDQVRGALGDDMLKPEYRGAKGCMKGHCYVASEALYHLLGGKSSGWVPHSISHEGGPHWYLKHMGGRIVDPTSDQFNTPVPYHKGAPKDFLTPLPSALAREALDRMLGDQKLKPEKAAEIKGEKETLDKGGLPMPGAPAHHHVVLPAGSTLNGKIKVQHSDGSQGWKQVQAGMITSQDPSHHPTSSRNPDSK